jgi:hypothetical protein
MSFEEKAFFGVLADFVTLCALCLPNEVDVHKIFMHSPKLHV